VTLIFEFLRLELSIYSSVRLLLPRGTFTLILGLLSLLVFFLSFGVRSGQADGQMGEQEDRPILRGPRKNSVKWANQPGSLSVGLANYFQSLYLSHLLNLVSFLGLKGHVLRTTAGILLSAY